MAFCCSKLPHKCAQPSSVTLDSADEIEMTESLLAKASSIDTIPPGQRKNVLPKRKKKPSGQPKSPHTKTLLSVREKTTGEIRPCFVSVAAYDTGYPPTPPAAVITINKKLMNGLQMLN